MWRTNDVGWLYVAPQKTHKWSQASKVFDDSLVRRIEALSDEKVEALFDQISIYGRELFENLRTTLTHLAESDEELRSGRSEAPFVGLSWVPRVVARDDPEVADLGKLITDQLDVVEERWRYDAQEFISMLLFLKFDPDESQLSAGIRRISNAVRQVASRFLPTGDLLRVEVSPEYHQVVVGDPRTTDFPEIGPTAAHYFASSQQVYVFTRGPEEGPVTIVVSRKDLQEAAVPTYESTINLTVGRLEVGTVVGADMTSVRVGKPGLYRVRIYATPTVAAEMVRVVVGPSKESTTTALPGT